MSDALVPPGSVPVGIAEAPTRHWSPSRLAGAAVDLKDPAPARAARPVAIRGEVIRLDDDPGMGDLVLQARLEKMAIRAPSPRPTSFTSLSSARNSENSA